MKKLFKLICAGVLVSALCVEVVACNDETKEPGLEDSGGNEQNEGPKGEDGPFSVYSLTDGSRWLVDCYNEQNYNKSKLLVINSNEEMKMYVKENYPPVDFTKKTLLLAYENYGEHVLHSDKQSFGQISEHGYVMTVNVPPFAGDVRRLFTIYVN